MCFMNDLLYIIHKNDKIKTVKMNISSLIEFRILEYYSVL